MSQLMPRSASCRRSVCANTSRHWSGVRSGLSSATSSMCQVMLMLSAGFGLLMMKSPSDDEMKPAPDNPTRAAHGLGGVLHVVGGRDGSLRLQPVKIIGGLLCLAGG